jgi:hypothetical protein
MNADRHRLSPDPNPGIASPGVALDDGLQDPDGFRTEAAERNNVAKAMIPLYDGRAVPVWFDRDGQW